VSEESNARVRAVRGRSAKASVAEVLRADEDLKAKEADQPWPQLATTRVDDALSDEFDSVGVRAFFKGLVSYLR
jgi:hypothetical protein